MQPRRNMIALLLLAIYLPIWLLSSFHIHACPLVGNGTAEEQSSLLDDESGCLFCQFQQLAYEKAPIVVVTVDLPETKVESVPMVQDTTPAFERASSSRAPPVLL